MMGRAYWDGIADDYEGNIHSVFDHDTEGRIQRLIARFSDREGRAADLGCGVGNFIPSLAEHFSTVEGCDFSRRSLAVARERNAAFSNVCFHELDFTTDVCPFPPVQLALCINVLIMASLDARLRAWRFVTNQVETGGILLLVVPAIESVLFNCFLEISEGIEAGLPCEAAAGQALPEDGAVRDPYLGLHDLEGKTTKHYLREELEVLLGQYHFETIEISKLSYAGGSGPAGERASWDWLVVGERL